MQMNALIPMQVQSPDLVGSMARGVEAARMANTAGRENALANLYRTQGAGMMAGDRNALNALAQHDPAAALGIQSAHQDMALGQKRMDVLTAQERRAAEEYARGLSAEQAQAEAAKIEQGVKMGMAAQSPQQWDALMQQYAPDLVGQFDSRQMLASKYMGWADILKGGSDLTKGAPSGYMWNNPQDQSKGVRLIPGYQPKGGQRITLGADGSLEITDGMLGGIHLPNGQNPTATATPRDGGKLGQKLSENDAATLKGAGEAAGAAASLESTASQLETLAPNVGYTGPGGSVYGAVDDAIGILPGDEGARGAFKSLGLEAQLSFTEKTKGAITDREMATFRSAVPGLGQRPEANKMISQVMRAGAARVQTRFNFLEAWARKNGSLEGSEAVWQEFMRDNPIISQGEGGLRVNPDGDWQGYLDRKPAMSYTPQAILGLTAEELAQIPVEQMTEAQLDAMERRFNELRGR